MDVALAAIGFEIILFAQHDGLAHQDQPVLKIWPTNEKVQTAKDAGTHMSMNIKPVYRLLRQLRN